MSNTTNGLIPTFVTKEWKEVWDKWNLRGFIILSLSLQTFLFFVAPLRKRTRRNIVTVPFWSAYLLADWAANFALGLISSSQSDVTETNNKGGLIAFWAPFLLVHLGGPDAITAFALEDNELWLRHFFGLIFQCLATIYVFLQSLPTDKLWLPTLLMFINGIIKYVERTRSLYLASSDSFRDSTVKKPDPGVNYAKIMDEYSSKKEARLPTRIEMIEEPERGIKTSIEAFERNLMPLEVVQYAYHFFETFKGLIINLIFRNHERNLSRDFFLKRTAKDAFNVVEVELNFYYEVLYTKLRVVYSKVGYICRPISLGAVIASLALFHSFEKNEFNNFDVGLTYTLLIGALALDGIALFMLIFSDWSFVSLDPSPVENEQFDIPKTHQKLLTRILTMLVKLKTTVVARRWSGNVGTYNLIYYCLHKRPNFVKTIYSYLGILGFIDEIVYMKCEPFTNELRDFIFEELKAKSELADDFQTSREICSSRGDWILNDESCNDLLQYIIDVDYDESILLWHVATEICYNCDLEKCMIISEENLKKMTKEERKEHKKQTFRKFSKLLSDYMLYLLVMKPTLTSSVGGIGLIRFWDTCAEADMFLSRDKTEKEKGFCFPLTKLFSRKNSAETKVINKKPKTDEEKQRKACKDIYDVNTEVKPIAVKGDRSKSVLFDGCMLAKELERLENGWAKKDKWEVLAKVWVELMSYAASHIVATSHVQQVSKGGELITMVWLLMAHLGLGTQIQINEGGGARAKLIVGK